MVTVFVRWASANVLQAGVWPHSGFSESRSLNSAWTRFAQLAAACMENALRANAFASKVGKALTVKIRSARMIVLVMGNAFSSQSTAPASASATMAGAALVVSGLPSMRSSRGARMTAQEMAYAWMACAHAMLDSRAQIAVTSSAQA